MYVKRKSAISQSGQIRISGDVEAMFDQHLGFEILLNLFRGRATKHAQSLGHIYQTV